MLLGRWDVIENVANETFSKPNRQRDRLINFWLFACVLEVLFLYEGAMCILFSYGACVLS